jgi:hypothetical protein
MHPGRQIIVDTSHTHECCMHHSDCTCWRKSPMRLPLPLLHAVPQPAQTAEAATGATAALPPAPPLPGPSDPTTPPPTALSVDAAPAVTASAAPQDLLPVQQPEATAALPPVPPVPGPLAPTTALPTALTAASTNPQDSPATQQLGASASTADLSPLSVPLNEVAAGQSSSGGARRLLRQKKTPADRQLRKMKLAQPHPIGEWLYIDHTGDHQTHLYWC